MHLPPPVTRAYPVISMTTVGDLNSSLDTYLIEFEVGDPEKIPKRQYSLLKNRGINAKQRKRGVLQREPSEITTVRKVGCLLLAAVCGPPLHRPA